MMSDEGSVMFKVNYICDADNRYLDRQSNLGLPSFTKPRRKQWMHLNGTGSQVLYMHIYMYMYIYLRVRATETIKTLNILCACKLQQNLHVYISLIIAKKLY